MTSVKDQAMLTRKEVAMSLSTVPNVSPTIGSRSLASSMADQSWTSIRGCGSCRHVEQPELQCWIRALTLWKDRACKHRFTNGCDVGLTEFMLVANVI